MWWVSCIVSNALFASLLCLSAWFMNRWFQQPAVARMLCVLALIKLVTPPLISVPLGEVSGTFACSVGMCVCGPHTSEQNALQATLPWLLLGIWLAGASARGWNFWQGTTHLRRLSAHTVDVPIEWQHTARTLCAELSIRRAPEILAAPGRFPPMIVPSLCRPRLLLPVSLLAQLGESQRIALLMHELTHVRRGDHRVRILELTVGIMYWWLPIAACIGRQLRICEELRCDAAVTERLPYARREYAALLLDVVDFANPMPERSLLQTTAMSAGYDLEQRLRAILATPAQASTTSPICMIAVVLALAILPCGLHYQFPVVQVQTVTPAMQNTQLETIPSITGNKQLEHISLSCCS